MYVLTHCSPEAGLANVAWFWFQTAKSAVFCLVTATHTCLTEQVTATAFSLDGTGKVTNLHTRSLKF